jgi:hypothetical protein
MKRADILTKVLLAVIAVGLWMLILRPVLRPCEVRAQSDARASDQTTDVLRARRFDLVDAAGNVMATLGPRDGPGVLLGMKRLRSTEPQASPADPVPMLALAGEDGKVRAALTLDNDGGPYLVLRDSSEPVLTNVRLSVSKLLGPRISMGEVEGGGCDLGAGRAGPSLYMSGPHLAVAQVWLTLHRADREPHLTLWSKDMESFAGIGVFEGKGPRLSLGDSGDTRTSRLGLTDEPRPGLAVRDKDNKVLWKAP